MKKSGFGLVAVFSLAIGNAYADATPAGRIDIPVINALLKTITNEVVKLEQVRDEDGTDLIGSIDFIFDPAKTDLDAHKVGMDASVTINTSSWKKGGKSSLGLSLNAAGYEETADAPAGIVVSGKLALATDTLALVRYAAQKFLDDGGCSKENIERGSKGEVDYNRDVCPDMEQLPKAADLASALDLILSMADKYVKYRFADPAAASDLKLAKLVAESLRRRPSKDSWQLGIPRLDLEDLFGVKDSMTVISGLSFSLDAKATTLAVTVKSAEAREYYDTFLPSVKEWLEVLQREDSDTDKKEEVTGFTDSMRFFIKFAKNVVLEKSK